MSLSADAPERNGREVLVPLVCRVCEVTIKADPKDDRDCPCCLAVDSLERPS